MFPSNVKKTPTLKCLTPPVTLLITLFKICSVQTFLKMEFKLLLSKIVFPINPSTEQL